MKLIRNTYFIQRHRIFLAADCLMQELKWQIWHQVKLGALILHLANATSQFDWLYNYYHQVCIRLRSFDINFDIDIHFYLKLYLHSLQFWGFRFWAKFRIQGSLIKGDFWKLYLLHNFCFNTFGVRHSIDVLDPEN